ncbi:L-aspartate oxidase [Candidatus Fermentibacteria bacterium]|nr:L-aspartate oxidase [Candidatus Fermentibacteria bacterium]
MQSFRSLSGDLRRVPETPVSSPDVIIIGSGMAGLVSALLIDEAWRVLIVTKKGRADSNTNFAQGGLAAAVGAEDCPSVHLVDTLRVGAGLCHSDVVRGVVEDGPAMVRRLQEWGVRFSVQPDGGFDLGKEGGHTRRRIVHALDRTGEEIERALLAKVRGKPNVQVIENALALDILTEPSPAGFPRVCGMEILMEEPDQDVRTLVRARAVVLATGGAGHVYQFTSNPAIATGDGVAMGFRCGASVSNLEFIQFHPTTFYSRGGNSFLISEAVRGEGGKLVLPDGSPFMHRYDSRAELAPRDIVARAVDQEMKAAGLECVYLDVTGIEADFARGRFPAICQKCLDAGIDFTSTPIPVVPAAHYICGGVTTDIRGATDVVGLFACGEVACTGLHGANRLASNSLLEAVVFATRVAESVSDLCATSPSRALPPPETVAAYRRTDEACGSAATLRTQIQECMWHDVGIVRSDRSISQATAMLEARVGQIRQLIDEAPGREVMEVRNIVDTARLIAGAAQWRKESRGLHFNTDYPRRGGARWRRDSRIVPPGL